MSLGATGLAGRYASALYALADDTGNVNEIVADLTDLAKLVADNDDIKMLISSPALTRSEQLAGITAITQKAGADAMTVKFLGTLAENGRLYALPKIISVFLDAAKVKSRRKSFQLSNLMQTARQASKRQLPV